MKNIDTGLITTLYSAISWGKINVSHVHRTGMYYVAHVRMQAVLTMVIDIFQSQYCGAARNQGLGKIFELLECTGLA